MKIVVHDACILIDLLQLDCLDTWLQCKVEVHTSRLALTEVEEDTTKLHNCGALHVRDLDGDEFADLVLSHSKQKKLSLQDCSVLRLAKELDSPLLTGDGDLRKTAEKDGVKVHGMLWVLDTMFGKSVIDAPKAASLLEQLVNNGSHLPRDEVRLRLALWRP